MGIPIFEHQSALVFHICCHVIIFCTNPAPVGGATTSLLAPYSSGNGQIEPYCDFYSNFIL